MKFLNLNQTARASVAIYIEKTDFDKLCLSYTVDLITVGPLGGRIKNSL